MSEPRIRTKASKKQSKFEKWRRSDKRKYFVQTLLNISKNVSQSNNIKFLEELGLYSEILCEIDRLYQCMKCSEAEKLIPELEFKLTFFTLRNSYV